MGINKFLNSILLFLLKYYESKFFNKLFKPYEVIKIK